MRRFRIQRMAGALLVAAPLVGAGLAQTFDIAIVNEGKPAGGVDVLMFVNQTKTALGTSGGDGVITVDMHLVNLGKGTPVDVYEIECDGEVVIVIVAPGEREALEEECERRRRENPNCTCRRIGGFLWGDDVTIDVGRGTVTSIDGPSFTGNGGGPIQLGLGLGYSRWPHVDRACNLPGVVGCELSDARVMYQALLDWYFLTRLGLSLELSYTPGLEVDHASFESGDGFPVRSVTELDVVGLGLLLAVRQSFGRAGLHAVFGSFGPIYLVNLGDVRTDYGGSVGILEESRHDPGLRLGARGGLDWSFGDGRWGSRFELGGTTGEDPDIDTNWFLGWKLLFRPGFRGL